MSGGGLPDLWVSTGYCQCESSLTVEGLALTNKFVSGT